VAINCPLGAVPGASGQTVPALTGAVAEGIGSGALELGVALVLAVGSAVMLPTAEAVGVALAVALALTG
jgi:hypothetical protein